MARQRKAGDHRGMDYRHKLPKRPAWKDILGDVVLFVVIATATALVALPLVIRLLHLVW